MEKTDGPKDGRIYACLGLKFEESDKSVTSKDKESRHLIENFARSQKSMCQVVITKKKIWFQFESLSFVTI